jgi:uncharacterized protein (TIGR03067 family)
MRRTVLLLAGVLLVAASLGSDAPKEYDGATENEIEGTWRIVAVDLDGRRLREEAPWGKLTFRAGRWQFSAENGVVAASYTTDASCRPAHLDVIYDSDTRKFVYRIDGNTLRMAEAQNWGDPRPRSIDGKGIIVHTYKRVK